MPPDRRLFWLWLALPMLLVGMAGAGWWLLSGAERASATPSAAPPPAVGVQPVVLRGVNQSFEFVGRVKAIDIVEVRARVEGFLEKVLFREGQTVRTGELLYEIEKAQYQAQVDQATANLAVAEAESVNARLEYGRNVELNRRQFSPQSVVDQNKAAVDTAAGHVAQFKAALTRAEINLGYTDIRSPIDGRVGRTAYTVGNLVGPSSGVLATIVSIDPTYVLFPVSVRDLETIREARRREGGLAKIEIRLRLSNGQEYPLPGRWDLTDPQVDPQTDSLIMRAVVPNPDGTLIDGQFVTAIIRERQQEQRLVVPQAALQVDQTGYYVLVVDGQHKVVQRRVRTGANVGTDVLVESGLEVGDNVIVDGIQKVRPGQLVQEAMLSPPAAASGEGR
ncbi:MAG: efflux RND transporter periplasmic adaptor subunit [Pseudomonadota bacterium]